MNTITISSLKDLLSQLIENLENNKNSYLFNPSHHSRKRKISFSDVIRSILQMSGGSLNHELLDYYECKKETPTASAFVQQRSKISSKAFEDLFFYFSKATTRNLTFKGFRLLAIDGSDLHIPTNPKDKDSYFAKKNDQRPYNLIHLNALFDICEQTYVDTIIQKARLSNENQALIDMVDRNTSLTPTIVIADRGYESYNALAHIQEKGWYFLFRIKDSNSRGGIANGLSLPDSNAYDIPINLHISAGRSQEHWELYKDKNTYKRISHPENFDFFLTPDGSRDIYRFYHLPFRIIKIPLENELFETIITNLPIDTFPSETIKELYAMRWGIETSFRHLKYPLGLLNFHARKADLIYQEIYAHMLMFNFVSLVTQLQTISLDNRKHKYKSSFSIAIHVCREFIKNKIDHEKVISALLKYLTPVRPGRKAIRRKKKDRSVMSFNYRIS